HSLVTLLGNLIDNGLDAVQQAEIKELNIRFSLLNHMLEIEIDDTGPGMPVEKIAQMFQRGYSTKGKNRGIGLFLVSAALDKLNGTMDVSSNPGDGMNFLIRIPLTVIKGSNDD
ncbi:MAG: GHKL domain-containing protein, partial [Budvicia sp.]|nr:GHKL domain-containing protein [Budvicia sp.]